MEETLQALKAISRDKIIDDMLLEYEESKREGVKEDKMKTVRTIYDRVVGESRAEGKAEAVQSLMITLHLTMEQAMAALQIPEEEQKKYRELLNAN